MSEEIAGTVERVKYKTIVYLICLIAALGGLLFGLDQGFIANSRETLVKHYHFADDGQAYSAILATGGIIGALLSGIFARFLGRKKSLVFAGFIFTGASIYSALLPDAPILSACRFALGFAVGVASFIVPLYLSETAPAKIRGSMGTLFQLMITIGIFLISLTNVFIAKAFVDPTRSLPLMFLTVAFFAALMFVGSFVLPESPRWLMLKGRKEKAVEVLTKTLSTKEEIDTEISEIEEALHGPKGAGFGIIFKGYFFKVLVIGILLQVFQQLVGINVMIYYAPAIFGYAGLAGLIAMMTVPTVNMLFTFPAIPLVEKWGRKMLLYVGAVSMLVTMVAAGLAFSMVDGQYAARLKGIDTDGSKALSAVELQASQAVRGMTGSDRLTELVQKVDSDGDGTLTQSELMKYSLENKQALAGYGQLGVFMASLVEVPEAPKWILLISVIIYIFGFAVSWGPVVWLVCSEIFPLEGREVGMTITTMVNWTFAGLVMANALTFMKNYGNSSIFYLFAVFCVLSIFYVALFVPETKGITLEELEINLKNGVRLRDLGTVRKG